MNDIFSLPNELRDIIFSYVVVLPCKKELQGNADIRKKRWDTDALEFYPYPPWFDQPLYRTNVEFILNGHDRTDILKEVDGLLTLRKKKKNTVSYLYTLLSQNHIYNSREYMRTYKDVKQADTVAGRLYQEWMAL